MIHRMLTNVAVLLSSCVACAVLGAAGCYAPAVEEPAGPAEGEPEAGDLPEDVGVAQEELTACNVVQPHGDSAFEHHFPWVMGCACHEGYIKDRYTVSHIGNGDCHATGWASTDPRDCRVLVTIKNSAAFLRGECRAHIEEKLDPEASCVRRCDEQAPAGCYCDSQCERFGDCCPNYASTCR
ncbi:hypothetical protein [Sorangium sp. So ce861]|uniref:hypothetical protein n=1 Tax=Sorangium sp. So ce861 TaxID=3133323 RepID=UPI003F627902